ncbi:glycosyltransferase [Bariatricus massiliensis]|uniref:Glycosyltransferase n=1 Tax=Bariatricus massiliensis TaxID=1745713 RepID=A0ABS8DIX7_9FIRM|nr:glycosyltransferase [Bariatricus massiliensis]MCB7305204.1 glycosyltransferase [Bariatricus massiliensis]MCB7375688.1 glycosyltransferase [Bariatricus massiliensis]MCB7388347.1 glycosyltransferase [Bariatricus massiliensis]MCB7412450.1 glycosyltransferase [Bariatricus massiliensis]MCQ5254156.1 glycosyltransferase [Bariatricus massiliensis]
MKILVIPSWYPSEKYPNNGVFFKEQVKALKKQGIDITVLCINIPYRKTPKEFPYFKLCHCVEEGIEVYRFCLPPVGIRHFSNIYYFLLRKIAIYLYKRELQNKGFDLIHAHSFISGGYIAIQLKQKFGCKCVITEHSSKILLHQLNDYEESILKKCVENSDIFISVSNNLKKAIENITGEKKKILVIPNMVNCIFSFKEKMQKDFIFASVGNLIPLKQMNYLVEAFSEAFKNQKNVLLYIAGDGPERDRLNQLIVKYQMQKQILLLGEISRKEVVRLLQRSKVMVLLSKVETFGIAYIEALATGNVILGSNNGGINDIVNKDNGVILDSLDIESIVRGLKKIYVNYDLYNPKEISMLCKENYGSEKICSQLRCEYEKLINEK